MKELAQQLRNKGLTYKQIACELGVSYPTAYNWLNPKSAEAHRQACRNYRQKESSKQAAAEYSRTRYKQDIDFKLSNSLRRRTRMALKRGQKAGSAVKDLGCSIEFLKQHLEYQFQKGMSWGNYGKWHIDHKQPLASFDLTNRKQFLKACHYTNLQPLWAADNQSKGDSCH